MIFFRVVCLLVQKENSLVSAAHISLHSCSISTSQSALATSELLGAEQGFGSYL